MRHIPMSLILDFSVLGALIVAVVYALLCFARKDAPYISNEWLDRVIGPEIGRGK